jgi:hypothetical protein
MSVTANIRMYNQQNLGDCFLLKFTHDKEVAYYMIDFGSYRSGKDTEAREKKIAEHIKNEIGENKLTIIVTHQHKDHLSGFVSAGDILASETAQRALWLSFLDNKNSKEGDVIRSATEKYWKKTKKVASLLQEKFPGPGPVADMLKKKDDYDLFAEEQIMGGAIKKLLTISKNNVTFLTPGQNFLLPGLSDGVRVYVLGPPTDKTQLMKMKPGKDEAVEGLQAALNMANLDISSSLMLNALENLQVEGKNNTDAEMNFPFSSNFVDDNKESWAKQLYDEEGSLYRQIEHEWLSEVGRMALHMDQYTNNTSLVLAFELVESKKVLLFVGDAQIGNWQSWLNLEFEDSKVIGKELLKRTVLYKAGHHSSHNATLKDGLELMDDPDLVIMIPVKADVAAPFAMLHPEMLRGYNRKSQGKVLRADTVEQNHTGRKGAIFETEYEFKNRTEIKGLEVILDQNRAPEDDAHIALELTIKG